MKHHDADELLAVCWASPWTRPADLFGALRSIFNDFMAAVSLIVLTDRQRRFAASSLQGYSGAKDADPLCTYLLIHAMSKKQHLNWFVIKTMGCNKPQSAPNEYDWVM